MGVFEAVQQAVGWAEQSAELLAGVEVEELSALVVRQA